MDNTDPTAIIILSEIVAVETIIIIGFAITFFIKRKKSLKQLKEIVSEFKKNIPDRKTSLKSTYSNSVVMNNSDPDKIIDDFVSHEEIFFTAILNAFDKKDISTIKSIEKEIHNLVGPYTQLLEDETASSSSSEKGEPNVPDIDSAIDDLLADEADDAEGDPALDLSEEIDSDDKIEEIPEELLSDNNTDSPSDDASESTNSTDENNK